MKYSPEEVTLSSMLWWVLMLPCVMCYRKSVTEFNWRSLSPYSELKQKVNNSQNCHYLMSYYVSSTGVSQRLR